MCEVSNALVHWGVSSCIPAGLPSKTVEQLHFFTECILFVKVLCDLQQTYDHVNLFYFSMFHQMGYNEAFLPSVSYLKHCAIMWSVCFLSRGCGMLLDETPLFEPSLLQDLDWSSNTVSFSPPISPLSPGEGLMLRPLHTADFNRGELKSAPAWTAVLHVENDM